MQIKQKWSSHLIRFMVLALSTWCFHPTDAKAQFVGNPLIPKEGKVIIYTNDAKGGHHQVATVAERNNISADRRQPGMLCTVMDDGTGKAKTFQLICKDLPAELSDNANWTDFATSGTGGGGTIGSFNGSRPITGEFYTNVNPGTNDLAKWIEAVFYPSVGPSASLTATPSGVAEMGAAGSTSVSLSWSAARAAATEEITEIMVNGTNVFSSTPAAGASVSGTQSATATNNTKTSFTMTVKTKDNKTASATASIDFQWKRYWGFTSGGEDGVSFAPTDAQILALSGKEFGTTAAVSNKSATPSGPQKLVIAFPASWGGGTKVIVGVNDSTGAFEKTTRSFTNAIGGTTSYVIYVQRDNTAAGLTFNIQ
ncbi:hypothetical protein FBD94_04665 [Pedobacter hiemivivus]|uniref:Uncharacterized protein n=1 Tax=Pedobacter hiemivivus TaxID=2530454 RepID=A0A4U1GJY2_9SPHI|nr:hypothetical protein [Pedobacter hiemivivus]TKC63649.1 hypothetical protein FBD94_04665 [Pedobacter hiemivivus]